MGIVSGTRFDFNNTIVEYDLHKGNLQPVFLVLYFRKFAVSLSFPIWYNSNLRLCYCDLLWLREDKDSALLWSDLVVFHVSDSYLIRKIGFPSTSEDKKS